MSWLSNGLSGLFKQGRKYFGNAIDNFWLDAEARKAISDEVGKKFQPFIDRANRAESRRATNITELDKKLTQSKQDLQDAQKAWQDRYNTALADARNQRQTEISNYDAKLQGYQGARDATSRDRQSVLNQLYDSETIHDPYSTVYIDVNTGDKYILNRFTNKYESITNLYKKLNSRDVRNLTKSIQGFEDRLFDKKSGNKLINVFNETDRNNYGNLGTFNNYLKIREGQNSALLRDFRDADNKFTKADMDLTNWQNANKRPSDWDDTQNSNDLKQFNSNFTSKNGQLPKEYTFNGQTYKKEKELNKAYQDALSAEQAKKDFDSKAASGYVSKRDAEIAKRIQDAKDMNKAKLALKAVTGAGALAAGAAALYGGDDTDNTDNTDNTNNIDNTDNTYTGEPDPDINIENTPEGKAALIGKSLVDTDFDSDKADALASAAYDQGVEDGNSARSSGDLVNSIAAATGGHTIDDGLFELLKAMKDPYKADAIANYIYSRHGDDPEVQRLGWRGWLNKYYGDSLRSKMNIDPSGYKGMHVSGGL